MNSLVTGLGLDLGIEMDLELAASAVAVHAEVAAKVLAELSYAWDLATKAAKAAGKSLPGLGDGYESPVFLDAAAYQVEAWADQLAALAS